MTRLPGPDAAKLSPATPRTIMYLVVRVDGRVWDGFGWNVKGKKFFTIASATRSLYESGEGFEEAEIKPVEGLLRGKFK